ncbi:MAG TPA: penicillin-binding protein, partial [Allosphingosinicella sp.]|nr:penicillin-binding protein [Allosphingosinicella sp.]
MSSEQAAQRITLRRASGRLEAFLAFVRRHWRKRWVKVVAILLALPFVAYAILWLIFARGLPSAESLLSYEPVLPTYVRDVNGEPVQTFA